MSGRPLYLRTSTGQSFGPVDEPQLRALIDQGALGSAVVVSEDGETFAPPGQFLHLRTLFPPELWGQADGPILQGDLAIVSATRAYASVAAAEATGQIELSLPDRELQIAFRRGNPEAVESNHPEDALEAFLVTHGVEAAKLEKASASKAQFGGDVLAALFSQGLANPATLVPLLSQRSQQIALKALLATSGTFRFTDHQPPQKAMPLGNRWAVLVELVRRIPTVALRRRLSDVRGRAPMRSGGKVSPEELRLTPKELRALSNVDGVRTLDRLVQESPADEEHLLRLIYLLRELDAVTFSNVEDGPAAGRTAQGAPPPVAAAPRSAAPPAQPPRGPPVLNASGPGTAPPRAPPLSNAPPTSAASGPAGSAPRAPPSLTPAPPRPTASAPAQRSPPGASPAPQRPAPPPPAAAAPVDFAKELLELKGRVTKTKGMTAFELLGVADKADSATIKAAYFKLAKQLHPDTVPPGAPEELGKLKAALFAEVGEAYRRIGDEKSRVAYVEELAMGGSEVDVSRILQAEEEFSRAEILVKGRRFAEALKLLDQAISNNPDEGEYYAWRGFARYFVTVDKKVAKVEAYRDLQEALNRNPKCVAAYYYLGQIAKLSEDRTAALRNFQKTIELAPHHIDAQRELRILGKK